MEKVQQSESGIRTFMNVFGDSLLWAATISAAVSTAVILATSLFNL